MKALGSGVKLWANPLARTLLTAALAALSAGTLYGLDPRPQTYKVSAKAPDAAELVFPGGLEMDGWLGQRIRANATNRLLQVDTEVLIAGFRKKPGVHPWIGEHIGKWMHAATLAWVYTGDPRLGAKLEKAANELIAAQEPDGYLGTYVPGKRFGLYEGSDWDVWSHKYNLIGLLAYYQYTGNEPALDACRKIGDLLIATFGPGRKSILSAGTHVGMAATSVLEPMVLLYRATGEEKYLEFCRYIVRSWNEPNGPKIIDALLAQGRVDRTANGKAYEMLSNLVGLCELARATGERELLTPVLKAWEDIASKRLYITGSASQAEHFHDDFVLPNESGARVAETCVTTTWIQLNLQLLRLTGEARFANELEKTFYNHLAAAQNPRGDDWCYFTSLAGRKPYDAGINCCHSSGPRGMALAALSAYLLHKDKEGDMLIVNTFETSSCKVQTAGDVLLVRQVSQFPVRGESELVVASGRKAKLGLLIRVPYWQSGLVVRLNGKRVSPQKDGWVRIAPREWSSQDAVRMEFKLEPVLVRGEHGNSGTAALTWGPFVMAYDGARNPGFGMPGMVALSPRENASLVSRPGEPLRIVAAMDSTRTNKHEAVLVPFADAGSSGGAYAVWLPTSVKGLKSNSSLLAGGVESRSRHGNVEGSITDADASTFTVTFDGTKKDQDWYGVRMDAPVSVKRIVFISGEVFHDGGWFDASKGKPKIEVQERNSGPWRTVGELSTYPATTATDPSNLRDSKQRTFTAVLKEAVQVVGVRVVGAPACGDNANQSFSSCAELQAFAE